MWGSRDVLIVFRNGIRDKKVKNAAIFLLISPVTPSPTLACQLTLIRRKGTLARHNDNNNRNNCNDNDSDKNNYNVEIIRNCRSTIAIFNSFFFFNLFLLLSLHEVVKVYFASSVRIPRFVSRDPPPVSKGQTINSPHFPRLPFSPFLYVHRIRRTRYP